jgi:adenylosuccinate lyase
MIEEFTKLAGKKKVEGQLHLPTPEITEKVRKLIESKLLELRQIKGKKERNDAISDLFKKTLDEHFSVKLDGTVAVAEDSKKNRTMAKMAMSRLDEKLTRKLIAEKGIRADGRTPKDIRPITGTVNMLARTHGQPASPTRLGKEIMVFVERLENQVQLFSYVPYAAKFGGATGNFNAHHIAYPKTDWIALANHFVEDILGLQRMQFTTQIEHYDHLAAHFDAIKRINNILIDLCRDIWTYISQDYFKQKTKTGEVGSSAMPHKVNPIDFENAEGNLGLANSLLEHLSAKLPISRLQRDLTDSTVLRNIGVPVAHTLIALASIEKGLGKLVLNEKKIAADLEENWAVVAEAIQTVLRRENYPNPYEALKDLTRGASGINKESMHKFIDGLKVNAALKKELKKITPGNYTGVCPEY